ncbi:DUF5302 domain-containing protein [Streptomyces sp. NPDC054884]|uniref:DUF5302 domain-containing protein n=1 Tax=unclassified Streptomyces TaxID=2593676 RepID=UPI0029A7127C|nr:DUF5302 domain-containing protein [Streptomyces sp. ME08-AFT2]MDX3310903.1 DUF5302 domain-containing protein [Streptomyces sp. ME08-AFT2]
MAGESSSSESAEPVDGDEGAPAPEHDGQDDLKRKFREALARKRGMQADAADVAANTDTSKVHGTHGPAASQRSFRRKSG